MYINLSANRSKIHESQIMLGITFTKNITLVKKTTEGMSIRRAVTTTTDAVSIRKQH